MIHSAITTGMVSHISIDSLRGRRLSIRDENLKELLRITDWKADADCTLAAEDMPEHASAWITDNTEENKIAKIVCESCPVRKMCITDAVLDPYSEGIRGGFLFHGGRLLSSDREKVKREFPTLEPRVRQKKSARQISAEQEQAS